MNDPGDLGRLHDIVAPTGFPFWPLAPGVWVLIAAAAALSSLQAWRAWLHYRADAYRRVALRELDALVVPGGSGSDPILGISAILKRVALISYPRERVANLSGNAWGNFIVDQAGQRIDVSGIADQLAGALKPGEGIGTADAAQLIAEAKHWVRRHRAAEEG